MCIRDSCVRSLGTVSESIVIRDSRVCSDCGDSGGVVSPNILVHSTDIAYCSRTGFVVKLIDVFKLRMKKLLS